MNEPLKSNRVTDYPTVIIMIKKVITDLDCEIKDKQVLTCSHILGTFYDYRNNYFLIDEDLKTSLIHTISQSGSGYLADEFYKFDLAIVLSRSRVPRAKLLHVPFFQGTIHASIDSHFIITSAIALTKDAPHAVYSIVMFQIRVKSNNHAKTRAFDQD